MNKIIEIKVTLLLCTFVLFFSDFVYAQKDSVLFDEKIYLADTEPRSEIALAYGFEALEIANILEDSLRISKACQSISFIYSNFGNHTSALKFALRSVQIQEKMNDLVRAGQGYNTIGTIYFYLGNYEQAENYMKKAWILHEKLDSVVATADDLNNLGEIFRKRNMLDSALVYYKLANEIFINAGTDSLRLAYSFCNIGLTEFQLGNKKDTLLHHSFEMLELLNDEFPVCIAYCEMAKTELLRNNLSEAKKYLAIALQIGLENSYLNELKDIYAIESKIGEYEKDFEKAYRALLKEQVLIDSLSSEKTMSQMAEMRTEYEINKKQQEVNYLNLLNKQQKKATIVLFVGVLLLLAMTLILINLVRRRKTDNLLLQEQNEELDQMNFAVNEALKEKEILMKEIHHRVKNNLQIISSIINLQSMRLTDPEIKSIFDEMQRRIMAISSIHQKLYQGSSVSLINMKDYLSEVIQSIHQAVAKEALNVNYQLSVQNVKMSIDAAVSIGLIVNELVTNAFKHAFIPNQVNNLLVGLKQDEKSKTCTLTVIDNGPGFPDNFNLANADSLGLRMVTLLTRQLKGTIEYNNNNGSVIVITFEEKTQQKKEIKWPKSEF